MITHDGPRPIETEYAGIRYRSRLEARWALFFDAAGIDAQYEEQGFELSEGGESHLYLPDFRLPCGTYVEVKARTSDEEMRWLKVFSDQVGSIMLVGPIPLVSTNCGDVSWMTLGTPWGDIRGGFGTYLKNKSPWWFFNEERERPVTTEQPEQPVFEYTQLHVEIADAYAVARKARFEHGENYRRRRRTDLPSYVASRLLDLPPCGRCYRDKDEKCLDLGLAFGGRITLDDLTCGCGCWVGCMIQEGVLG